MPRRPSEFAAVTRPIYVRFSDDGKHIAKWSHEPFEPSVSYVPAPTQLDQAREVEFNVNETVRVRLTDEGRAYHAKWYAERYPTFPYRQPDESDDGWSRWQLWAVMQEFGEGIFLGGRVPFETAIRIPASKLRTPDRTDGGAA